MSQHQKARWQTVGPHWNSVRPSPTGSASSSPVVHHGFHALYLNAISRPDLNPPLNKDDDTLSPQLPTSPGSSSAGASVLDLCADSSSAGPAGVPPQILEHRRQQQLYLQQLELMQKLQTMPGSTTRLWYPTFGPTVTTTCSDSTILLDNPQQYALSNSARLNRHAVGPHWRSIQTYSPSSSSPSSPQPLNHSTTTAGASPSPMMALYASAASINQVRAASFCMHDDRADQVMSDATRPSAATSAATTTSHTMAPTSGAAPEVPQANYITGHYAGAVRYPDREPVQHNHSHPHPTYPYYINTTPNYRERPELSTAMSRSTSQASNASMESVSTALTSGGQSDKKRRAPWHDEDVYREDSASEEQHELEHYHTHDQDQELPGMDGGGDSFHGHGAVTQFVPVTRDGAPASTSSSVTASCTQQLMDQDTDMICAPAASTFAEATREQGIRSPSRDSHVMGSDNSNNHAYRMSVDFAGGRAKENGANLRNLKAQSAQERSLSHNGDPGAFSEVERHAHHLDFDGSVDVDGHPIDFEQSQSRPIVQPRRTRIRRESDENDLAAEARRKSGEVIRDIFQECFYNAAASSSR
ncbi:hypothetical protein BGZ73_006720 [Actinomortierella ambigua]|nr:hypothetical protein BGZ73_006720 [Actinomortierella ambigua]